jgi:OHCU decarboxylase
LGASSEKLRACGAFAGGTPAVPANHLTLEGSVSELDLELASLNSLSPGRAEAEFLKCCGSKNWALQVTSARPFASLDELIAKADRIWWSLDSGDWLEAFHSHPKIGEKKAAAPTAAEAQQWSEDEQSGIRNSAQLTLDELADLNRAYEEKFGYIYIVCASGKSSEEMLAILRDRLKNNAAEELRIAAAEQAKITELRLRKLLAA